MQENNLEILNTGSYAPFLWCLDVAERALALKSRLKRRQLTPDGLNLITGLALTIYRFFYEFTDFGKITERKNQNINFQELQLWLNEGVQNK
jgi:hypothetical protein